MSVGWTDGPSACSFVSRATARHGAILRTHQRWVIAKPREASQGLFSRCVESAEPLSASFVPLASVSSFAVVCSFPCPSCHPCLPYPLLSAIRCRDRRPHETLMSSRTSDASIVAGPAPQEMSCSVQPARREPPDASQSLQIMRPCVDLLVELSKTPRLRCGGWIGSRAQR